MHGLESICFSETGEIAAEGLEKLWLWMDW